VLARPSHPCDPRRPRRPRRDDLPALVTAGITAAERSVAAEAVACAIAGNTVVIPSNRVRTAREIAEIVDVVAFELHADVQIGIRGTRAEVRPPGR
jgi:hypothetical protein